MPVLIDAASELPPESVLARYTTMGAVLVVVSGGKRLEGLQSTGILVGRKDLIAAAALNYSPNTAIGRGTMVGKQETIGLITAVKPLPWARARSRAGGLEQEGALLVEATQSNVPALWKVFSSVPASELLEPLNGCRFLGTKPQQSF